MPHRKLAHFLIDNYHSIPEPDAKDEKTMVIVEIYNALFDPNTTLPSFFDYNEIVEKELCRVTWMKQQMNYESFYLI